MESDELSQKDALFRNVGIGPTAPGEKLIDQGNESTAYLLNRPIISQAFNNC